MWTVMGCFQFNQTIDSCCEDPYVLTQRDRVHQCIREEILSMTREAYSTSNSLIDSGMDSQPHLNKVQDLQFLLDWLKDRWDILEEMNTAGTLDMQKVWNGLQIDCIARYFRCEYGVNVMRAVHSAGLYDPSKPSPGMDIPVPGVA